MFVAIYIVYIMACTMQLTTAEFITNITHPCHGLNYCTIRSANYPQELVNNIVKRKYDNKVILQPRLVTTKTESRGLAKEGEDDCISTVTLDPLKHIRDHKGKWRTVLQAPDLNFLQTVRLETCDKRDSPCFEPFKVPEDLVPYCKQEYNVWNLLVLDDNNGTEKINVQLPTCCTCVYKAKH